LDGQDTTIFDDVFEFVGESGLYEVQITVMTAFPGTPLYERLTREGRILTPGDWSLCTLFDVNYRPDRMTVKELETGFMNLAERLYSDEFTKRRKRNFKNALKRTRIGNTASKEAIRS
jgi:radical SAM superfamily enzyme YgiQ (UPF0313 family)